MTDVIVVSHFFHWTLLPRFFLGYFLSTAMFAVFYEREVCFNWNPFPTLNYKAVCVSLSDPHIVRTFAHSIFTAYTIQKQKLLFEFLSIIRDFTVWLRNEFLQFLEQHHIPQFLYGETSLKLAQSIKCNPSNSISLYFRVLSP